MRKSTLRATTALQALALLGMGAVATPAFAQDATPTPAPATSTTTSTSTDAQADGETVVVTGSMLRRTTTETPSPVTVVTAESLDQRGISTVQDGLQSLAANNGPALTNSFTANGAFAGGASAVSLRGLSTNSTLVLFDGLRASYYPLADDGSRNFVDLNTIPDDIVEKVEVLRDGASSSYGADAIAGVVNIITKREFTGLSARAEAGISSRGDAPSHRLGLTLGTGKIAEQGFNAYISGFYYDSKKLYNRDRPGVFGTDDLRTLCTDGVCGANGVVNGLDENNAFPNANFGVYGPFVVRAQGTTRYQNIDVALGKATTPGCRGFSTYTLTAAELAGNPTAPQTVCQVDLTHEYGLIQPNVKRFGVSSRVTAALGDNAEAYFEANFLQSNVDYTGFLPTIRGNAPTGIYFPRFSTSTGAGAVAPGSGALALPVYVCAAGVGTATGTNTGCDATNGVLNPYNPYAAAGKTAQILGQLPDPTRNATRNRSYRAAGGVKGTFMTDVDYSVMGTLMHTDLRREQNGYVYIQSFLNAIARGQYNFLNPSATPQSVLDYIMPDNVTNASSDLYEIQGTLTKPLMQLAGGPLQLGVGTEIHYEKVDSPSANSDIHGPTQRYFTLNAFGTSGSRTVKSAFAELDAPVLDMLGFNLSARYDDYSSGQSAFSPKIGVKFTPIKQVALRGTFSKGFRIPSFGEANALPTTGYVTASKGIYPDSYLAQYGCSQATYTTKCPAYLTGATYGLTTLASPNLDPEKSRSITLGAILEPIRNWSATVDFYDIKKTGAIANPSTAPAIAAYYATGATQTGNVTVIPDAPDVNNPNARPKIAFVQASLINADTNLARGIDFGMTGRHRFGSVKWTTALDASYILKLQTKFADGHTERYDGTLGNFNLTAGSGTPKWHGNWQNSFDFGMITLTGTANYFGGYDMSAMDQGGDYKDCSLASGALGCKVPGYTTFDANAQVKISDRFTVYGTVLNLFDNLPPYDDITYGAHLYNPVQGGTGILGRYFKGGIKVNL